MTVEEQLKEIIISRYKSVRAFTKDVDIPYSTVDMMLKRGIGGTGVTTVIKIFHQLGLDVESISTGTLQTSRKIKKSPAAQNDEGDIQKTRLIRNYNILNTDGRSRLIAYSDDLTAIEKYTEEELKQRYRIIKYFDQPVSAGYGEWIDDNSYSELEIPDLPEYTAVDFALRVHGDSMEPDYADGDIVLVHSQDAVNDRCVSVWWVEGEGTFIKEYRKGSLYPHNKKYSAITLTGKDFRCFGKVIAKLNM